MSLRPLSRAALQTLRQEFYNCDKNKLAQNACFQKDPIEIAISRQRVGDEKTQHVFTHKIEIEGKPVCDQKSSGRCWNFAAHNVMRIAFMKQWNLDEFEFSQAHFFYWDKIERSYYFLNNIVETVKRGESVEGRLVSFLLSDPIGDGGQWDMIVNIINKHGLMPKKCFPESFSSESSARMNAILKSKLREYSKVIRDLMNVGASNTEVQTKVDEQMGEIYNIVGICLGIPPEKFTFEYYDKNKKYTSIGPITPIEFYEQYVKAYYNVDDKVCLVTDPRPTNEFGKAYTVDCLGNVVGGRPVFYNNQPVDVLIDLITKSLKDNEAVLFACDLCGLNNINLKNFKLIADEVKLSTKLEKFDRIALKDATKKLLMIIIGFNFDLFGKPQNLLIEPLFESKSSFSISCENFEEVVSEIIIDRRKFASDTQVQVLNSNPIVLDIWDYLGLTCK